MNIGENPEGHIRSKKVAYMLGITDVQLSKLKKQIDHPIPVIGKAGREFLFDIYAVHQWDIKRQIRNYYRGTTTKEDDTGKVVDFNSEKTRLTKAQADSKELDNLARQGKLAELSVLAETLSNAMSIVVAGLDSIPAELRRKCPHLDQATVDEIQTIIASVRNSLTGDAVRLPDPLQGIEGSAE